LIIPARQIRSTAASNNLPVKQPLYGIGVAFIFIGSVIVWTTSLMLARSDHFVPTLFVTVSIALAVDMIDSKLSYQPLFQFRKFSFFMILVLVGSGCMHGYYSILERNGYEYAGPMRIMHIAVGPQPWPYGEDSFGKGSRCTNRAIVPSITIGWGKAWGCRTRTDRWNTNYINYNQCSALLCEEESAPGVCNENCYSNADEARAASFECIEQEFDLSRLSRGETFDKEQPPWEDPSWPTIVRYGTCDGNVGFSATVEDVEKSRVTTYQKRNVGIACLVLAVGLLYQIRNQPLVPRRKEQKLNHDDRYAEKESDEEENIALLQAPQNN
jgi:hypothetical protein